jgi:hypothetical protein
MEGDKIILLKAEFARREEEYMEIIKMVQEDYEKFKNDTTKEFDLRDTLQKRL